MGAAARCATIRRRSGLSKQTMNSAIRKLEEADVLYLEPDGGRAKNAHLTAHGQTVAEATAMRILRIEKDISRAGPKRKWRPICA